MKYLGIILLFLIFSTSCTSLKRSRQSGYGNSESYNYKKSYLINEKSNSSPSLVPRSRLKELEKKLDSKKEREQYSKILPWLTTEEEKIEFLSIPSVESRQEWINSKKIWQRSQIPTKEYKDLIDAQDITIGMPMDYVKKAWGEPLAVEHSGNPTYKNERWKYLRQLSTGEGFKQEKRWVYFEGGRVVGWETE